MISFQEVAHYLSPALLLVIPSLSIAYGQSAAARTATKAIETQPEAAAAVRKNFLFSLAVSETAAILTLIIVMFLLMSPTMPSLATTFGHLAILLALGIPSTCIGIFSSFAQKEALLATARQPFFAAEIFRLTLITVAVMQTSVILGFILALLLQGQLASAVTLQDGLILLATGIAFGCGTIGPLFGLGIFSGAACKTIGINRKVYPQVLSFTFLCQGLIEAPILFSLVVALLITSGTQPNALACLAAALTIALTTLGPGIASGRIARAACMAIGQQPQEYRNISSTSLLAQTLVDTAPIYGMIIALSLLLFA